MSNFIDLIGQRFGKLLVIERSFLNKRTSWKCRCECNNETIVLSSNLKSGGTKSCGCLNKEVTNRTHGMRYSKEYNSWRAMIKRCTNEKHESYPNYGGRGITICERWLKSFENFHQDLGDRPCNHTLDRINSNGNYEPSNCKWSSTKEQGSNKRTNIKIEFNGETLSLKEYCFRNNLIYRTILSKLRRGISLEDIILK